MHDAKHPGACTAQIYIIKQTQARTINYDAAVRASVRGQAASRKHACTSACDQTPGWGGRWAWTWLSVSERLASSMMKGTLWLMVCPKLLLPPPPLLRAAVSYRRHRQ